MSLVELTDRKSIFSFLSSDPYLHLYSIGDLDDFFWSRSRFFGWSSQGSLKCVFLLYSGDPDCPTLLALERENRDAAGQLLQGIEPLLPERFYAHLSPFLVEKLSGSHHLDLLGHRLKMKLDETRLRVVNPVEGFLLRTLTSEDRMLVQAFYESAYPENWFDSRMLETGTYLGLFDEGLSAVAGVHVYSEKYRVAALGNIAVRSDLRGLGLGAWLTFELCQKLLARINTIGLNVDSSNAAAIRCYEKVGFEPHSHYDEFRAHRLAR